MVGKFVENIDFSRLVSFLCKSYATIRNQILSCDLEFTA